MNGVTILFVYAVIMILATVILTKKEKNVERFCVGSRSENWLMSALSIAATWIWAPALFVSTEKAYSTGWVGLFWFLVPNALCLVIFIPFAKKIRKEMPEGMTLSGYMKEKYKSDGVKRVYLFQLIGLSVLSTGVQLLAGSQILSAVTGISFKTMTILLACIAISYSLFSGIKASMLTDAIQMVFMLVACSLFVIFGVRNTGTLGIIQGLSGISGDCTTLFSGKGVEIFLAFGLPTTIGLLSGPFGDQSFWQRVFAVKKEKLGRAFLLGAVLFAVVPLSMGILGFMGAGAGYQAQNLGIINFELIRHFFPSWAVLPFLFMIVSGLLSTVDSNLCAVSSLTTDIAGGKDIRKTRSAMAVLLIAGILIANIPGITVTHLFLFYGTLRASTLLADFIMLGHEKTGSFALSSDKTELFSVALGAFLDVICETFNNQGIPSLIDINGSHFDGIEDYPTLAHGDVDKRDITKLSTFLKDMVGTGILIPDEELEDYVREAANLPERTEVPDSREKDERREAQRRAPEKTANEPDGPEVDPEENQDAEEAKKRLGR